MKLENKLALIAILSLALTVYSGWFALVAFPTSPVAMWLGLGGFAAGTASVFHIIQKLHEGDGIDA